MSTQYRLGFPLASTSDTQNAIVILKPQKNGNCVKKMVMDGISMNETDKGPSILNHIRSLNILGYLHQFGTGQSNVVANTLYGGGRSMQLALALSIFAKYPSVLAKYRKRNFENLPLVLCSACIDLPEKRNKFMHAKVDTCGKGSQIGQVLLNKYEVAQQAEALALILHKEDAEILVKIINERNNDIPVVYSLMNQFPPSKKATNPQIFAVETEELPILAKKLGISSSHYIDKKSTKVFRVLIILSIVLLGFYISKVFIKGLLEMAESPIESIKNIEEYKIVINKFEPGEDAKTIKNLELLIKNFVSDEAITIIDKINTLKEKQNNILKDEFPNTFSLFSKELDVLEEQKSIVVKKTLDFSNKSTIEEEIDILNAKLHEQLHSDEKAVILDHIDYLQDKLTKEYIAKIEEILPNKPNEEKIQYLKSHIDKLDPQISPELYPYIKLLLAGCYEESKEYKESITLYLEVLESIDENKNREYWVNTKIRLGAAYFYNDNITDAILCFEKVLPHANQSKNSVLGNLGFIYLEKVKKIRNSNGEKKELKTAIARTIRYLGELYEFYGENLTLEENEEKAEIEMLLGEAYFEKIDGEEIENLGIAEEYYNKALLFFNESFPEKNQKIKEVLGRIYSDKNAHEFFEESGKESGDK